MSIQATAAVADWRSNMTVNGTPIGSGAMDSSSASDYGVEGAESWRSTAIPAGAVLDLRLAANIASAAGTAYDRAMNAMPVRVG